MSDKDSEAFEEYFRARYNSTLYCESEYRGWQAALAHSAAEKDAEIERLRAENFEIRGHNQGLADALRLGNSKFWRLVQRLEGRGYKIPDEWFDGAAAEKNAEIEFHRSQSFDLGYEAREAAENVQIARLQRVVDAANKAYDRMVDAGLGLTDEGIALVNALAAAQQEG